MAELADALDSGSSRGSSVKVQVLLPAPQKALKTLRFQGFLLFFCRCHTAVEGTHDLWQCVCLFSVRGEGFRGKGAVLIVKVKVTAEGGFEIDVDRQLSVALVNHDIVNE